MGRRISHSEQRWAVMAAEGHPAVRCVAPTQAGTQCKREALAGSIVCDKHGSHLPNVQKRAKERYVNLADKARTIVESILDNPKSSDAAKLKAAEMVMKATGMEDAKKVVVDVQSDPLMRLMGDLLGDPDGLVERPREIVPGEVVPDPAQEAIDRLEESWTPDAEVLPLDGFGRVGPHAVSPPRKSTVNPPKHIRDGLGL